LRVNLCAARDRPVGSFQHQKNRSFAGHYSGLMLLPGRKQAMLLQAEKREFVRLYVAAACQRTAGIAALERPNGRFDGLRAFAPPKE
jgi:hypothetical protein